MCRLGDMLYKKGVAYRLHEERSGVIPVGGRSAISPDQTLVVKEGLYRMWCGVNTFGDDRVNTLGDTSAFVNPTVQPLLTRRSKIRMDGVGILFEFYTAPL